MRWHVRKILPVIAEQYRGGGISLCDEAGVDAAFSHYNRINEILMNRHDWPGSDDHICLPVFDGVFSLPSQFEGIKAFRVAGEALPILSLGFRYLESGPGLLNKNDGMNAMQHLGSHFSTMRDMPRPLPIFAVSESDEFSATLTVHGEDRYGKQRRETVPVARSYPDQSPIHTVNFFSKITAITKSVTTGNVELAAWDDNTGEVFWITSMMPDETNPTVTRYLLPGVHCEPVHLVANVSIGYRELHNIDDVSLIQHREAYRLMTQALTAWDNGDAANGAIFQNVAMKMLKERAAKLAQGQAVAIPFKPSRQLGRVRSVRG